MKLQATTVAICTLRGQGKGNARRERKISCRLQMISFWGKLIEEEMVRITTQRRQRAGGVPKGGASKSYKVQTLA